MGDNTPSHSFPPPPPPPHSSPKITIPSLYYGLAVVTTAAVVLIVYNLIIIRWCSNRRLIRSTEIATQGSEPSSSQSFDNPNIRLVSSFKYTKEKGVGLGLGLGLGLGHDELDEYECPICLSVFEEGEDVRQLPSCNHSFHVPCIDMWLFSHADCPVCRATVEPPLVSPPNHRRNLVMDREENSREGLMDITVLL